MSQNSENDYRVPALSRGLTILEMFNQRERVLTTQDFARHLGVSVSSIYRIIQTLVDARYLRKVARNSYELGPAVVSPGFSYMAGRDVVDVAAPHLNRLRDATSVSCHLGIRDSRDVLYVYRSLAAQRLSVNVPVGTRLPCHSSAMGRVLLSLVSDEELGQLYLGSQLDGVPRPHPQSLPELRRLIREDNARGYAVSFSDYAIAIAAPIRNYANEVVAAVNISGPEVYMQDEAIHQEVREQLLNTAAAISKEMGCPERIDRALKSV